MLNIAKNTVVSFNLLQNLGKFEYIFKLLEVCFCLFLLEIDKKVFNFNHRNETHKLTFNQKKKTHSCNLKMQKPSDSLK